MVIHFLDTSAILNGGLHKYGTVYVSPLVLTELENIKQSNKNEQIKYQARVAVREIINKQDIMYQHVSQKALKKIIEKYDFLTETNDHLILAEAEWLGRNSCESVHFITSDGAQYLFATQMPHITADFFGDQEEQEKEEYCGWSKHYPTEDQLNMLYSDKKMNILNCKINEFAEIFVDNNLKDILVWNGKEYRNLKYKEIKNPYLEEVLRPRNIEQKMAFDLLQNQDIKVKLLTSAWGGGKTLMALTYALEQVYKGRFSKLLFVRNNIIVADTNDIGYLPGSITDKMSIWGGPIADHLGGQDMLNQLILDGVIEIFPLSHIRGRSIKNTIVICDECENMNDKLVTLLMSRIEESSELIFCGDVAQIDNHRFEKNNGIKSMLQHLSGQPLFGTVKLLKSERGSVAQMCDLMRPPV